MIYVYAGTPVLTTLKDGVYQLLCWLNGIDAC